jgi:hypothetical protein
VAGRIVRREGKRSRGCRAGSGREDGWTAGDWLGEGRVGLKQWQMWDEAKRRGASERAMGREGGEGASERARGAREQGEQGREGSKGASERANEGREGRGRSEGSDFGMVYGATVVCCALCGR